MADVAVDPLEVGQHVQVDRAGLEVFGVAALEAVEVSAAQLLVELVDAGVALQERAGERLVPRGEGGVGDDQALRDGGEDRVEVRPVLPREVEF